MTTPSDGRGDRSRVDRFLLRPLGYLLGTIIALWAVMVAIGGSWFTTTALALLALVLLPPTWDRIRALPPRPLSGSVRLLAVLALAFGFLYAGELDHARFHDQRTQEYMEGRRAEFAGKRDSIFREIEARRDSGDYTGILNITHEWERIGNDSLMAAQESAYAALERQDGTETEDAETGG